MPFAPPSTPPVTPPAPAITPASGDFWDIALSVPETIFNWFTPGLVNVAQSGGTSVGPLAVLPNAPTQIAHVADQAASATDQAITDAASGIATAAGDAAGNAALNVAIWGGVALLGFLVVRRVAA